MNKKPPFSIRLIYWFTNFILGMLVLVSVGVIVFNIMVATDSLRGNMQLHTEFPAKVDILDKGVLILNGVEMQVELVEASARIHIFDTPAFITGRIGLVLLVVVALMGYMVWKFRKFIVNVKNGDVFSETNIRLLKHLAYGLVAFWVFIVAYMHAAYYYLARNVEFAHVRVRSDVPEYGYLLGAALFLWVLAHIFTTGLELQRDKDLTV